MTSPSVLRIHHQAPVPLAEQAWVRDALSAAEAEGTGAVWVIVPTGKARLGIHDALLSLRPHGVFLPRVEAFDTLVTRLSRLAGGRGHRLSRAAHSALIAHVLLEASEHESVRELSVGRTFPGVTRGLDGLFRALGRHKIWDASVFRTQLHRYRQGETRVRDDELVRVYERYRASVARDGGEFVTESEEIDHVIRHLEAAPPLLRGVRRVVWFGFADLSPLQADLVTALASRVPTTHVTVHPMPAEDEDGEEDGLLHPIETRVTDSAARASMRVETTRDEPTIASAEVTWTGADDPLREVRSVAALVRKKLDAGTPPRDLAVAFADLDLAIPYVREVFPKYEIPFQAERGVPLISVPAVGRVLGVIDLVVRRYRRVDLEELARSRAFGGRVRHALDLDRVARGAKIVGGGRTTPDVWRSTLRRAADRTTAAAEEANAPRWKTRERDRVGRAIDAAEDLFALTAPLEDAMTKPVDAAAFRRLVFTLLHDVDGLLPPPLAHDNAPARGAAQRDARALHQFLTALEEFCDVLRTIGAGRDTLPEWMSRFRAAITDVWVSPMEETQRGVPVVTIHDLRFLPATDVFIGGLTDAAFPRRLRPDLFVPETRDRSRDFLSIPDVASDDLAALQRELSQRQRLHLSYPRVTRGIDQLGAMWVMNEAAERTWPAAPVTDRHPVALTLEDEAKRIGRREASVAEAWSPLLVNSVTAPGAARVAHALRVSERRRWHDIGPWTGFVDLPSVSPALAHSFAAAGDRVFSISQLQTYAQCPHRWFAARALGLAELEEVDEDLTPLERGSLAHDIVESFYRFRPDGESLDDAATRRRLAACVEDALAQFPPETLIGEARRAAFTEGLMEEGPRRGMLVRFLDVEREREREGWRVADVEWSFGDGDARFALDTPFGPVRIRGRIDRIDHHPERGVLVFDYKTGNVPSDTKHHGRLFQLAVYVDAGRGSHATLADERWDAAYYALAVKKGEVFGPRESLGEARDIAEALAEVRTQIGQVVGAAARGSFPLTVMDDVDKAPCKYCSFQDLCRVREGRLDRRRASLAAISDRVYVPERVST